MASFIECTDVCWRSKLHEPLANVPCKAESTQEAKTSLYCQLPIHMACNTPNSKQFEWLFIIMVIC